MSNLGVHDFAIPHEFVQPTRDMVIIQLPLPPKFVGDKVKFEIPQQFRDMAQHNVMAGRIIAMGPLAFTYKDGTAGNTLKRQDVGVGDWVVIRPYAGTMLQGGKFRMDGGFRYVSSFQDIIGIVPTANMPDPATLIWEDDGETAPTHTRLADDFNFHNNKQAV